jgi:hypothetical protein
MSKFLGFLTMGFLALVCFTQTARAGAMTQELSFIGQPFFRQCSGAYSMSGNVPPHGNCNNEYSVSGSLTVVGPFNIGWNSFTSPSYSLTDGGFVTLTQANSVGGGEFYVSGYSDTITQWVIEATCYASCGNAPSGPILYASIYASYYISFPGLYDSSVYITQTAEGGGNTLPAPEPASLFLFGTSLLGLAPFRRRLFGR